ncbi:MAG: hypothetical protein KMY53_07210 [Desulfarculus sp.]|nr:hypothetical protein [Pseudomonadota bacterium]MBV1715279.1 hypothetical protein [Desulfarculus sp.]MBU4575343.1 hypothetical protein [Pseudomonadota bacterium]MBU4597898.1 hypothetical protein [Pseudomonadota bacterium]MBV1737933.1 hypothetical protein [Desulfarculus sp.]
MATDVQKTWDNTGKTLADSTKNALKGTVVAAFDGEMDQVGDIWEKSWDDMVTKVDGLWDKLLTEPLNRAMTGLSNMFKEMIMDPVTKWFTGLFSGSGWDGGSGSLLDALQSGASLSEAWEFAGLPGAGALEGVTSWVSSLFGGGTTAAVTSAVTGGGVPAAIAEGWGITAGVTDMGVAAGTGASQSMATGALAAGLAGPGMAMALGPGLVGMMFNDQINSLFGFGDPMTPEEAEGNWEGTLGYMEQMTAQMEALGVSFDQVQQGVGESSFGLFGQSAQEAAQALERLRTVAGYSQEQIDALVASLDPLTQEFLASGQAAIDMEGQVGGLVQEMNAAINSYTMTSDAVNLYNGRIDALAERLGLSGEAARAFRDEIWDLAEGFSSGGEEAEQFDRALSDFIGNTLGSLTEGAEDGTEAINNLIDSMGEAQGMREGLTGLGTTGGGGSKGGSTRSGGGEDSSDESVNIGVMHGGGYVMGWPKAHAGALISSLAHDEVPLIARRGEYVVRAEAVTPATLPALKALNQGAALQAAYPAVNLHVEIHGNMLGSRDNLEDLARLLEGKLRELDRGRWKA